LIVGAGFFAGRRLGVDRDSVAKLAIYIVSPIVILTNVSQIEWRAEYLAVPFGFLGVCSVIALLFLALARIGGSRFGFAGNTANLLAFAAGNANTGYFGLPVALMLFGSDSVGVYLLFCLGFILYENTVGFYILARGNATAREAALRLAKLPSLYAFIGAIAANRFGMRLEGVYADFSGFFRGTYSVLGMMLVGLGVAELRTLRFDWRFVSATFVAKFIAWPLVVGAFLFADRNILGLYDSRTHQMMALISCTPLAANTVAFATLLKTEPEKAGVAVLLSTLFALFYIPLLATWIF
jgi:predicted permease